jgi:hypothetical protein
VKRPTAPLSGRTATVARMHWCDLRRRRLALLLLVAMPAAFYLSLPPEDPFAPMGAVIGLAFTVAGAAFFVALAGRRIDPRLVLAGYRPGQLIGGRLLMLEVVAAALGLAFAILTLRSDPARPGILILASLASALLAVPIGLAIAAALPHELEGMLLIIGLVGVGMSVPPSSAIAPYLPVYGPGRLVEVAVSGGDPLPPLLHAAAWTTGLLLLAWLVTIQRVPRNAR